MFSDLDWPLYASRGLSVITEYLVLVNSSVCVSISMQHFSNRYGRILMKFLRWTAIDTRKDWVILGNDPAVVRNMFWCVSFDAIREMAPRKKNTHMFDACVVHGVDWQWHSWIISDARLRSTECVSSVTTVVWHLGDAFDAWPRAGSGVVRMDPLRFLAGCRTRRLNQA